MGFTGYKHNLEGLVFGRFEVIKRLPAQGSTDRDRIWLSKCLICQTERVLTSRILRDQESNKKTQCNCYWLDNKATPTEKKLGDIFHGVKQRCYDSSKDSYHRYGGRGITVCDEWLKQPKLFYDWSLANGYKKGLQIDRIDNNGNYCPENCRWVTCRENNNNKSNCNYLVIGGDTLSLSEAVRKYNPTLSLGTAQSRLTKGWKIEAAVLMPPLKYVTHDLRVRIREEVLDGYRRDD